jgi:hypothetical protein
VRGFTDACVVSCCPPTCNSVVPSLAASGHGANSGMSLHNFKTNDDDDNNGNDTEKSVVGRK